MSNPTLPKSRFRRFAADWFHNRDGWGGIYKGRYRLCVWRFGDIWQCCVEAHPKGTALTSEISDEGSYAWMALWPQKTMNNAMKHARDWCDRDDKSLTVQQTFDECFKNHPTLFRVRRQVIDHLFFVNGNGYCWLDGALMSSYAQKTPEEEVEERRAESEWRLKNNIPVSDYAAKFDEEMLAHQAAMKIGPLTEVEYRHEKAADILCIHEKCEHPSSFYAVCKYANINHVPDDVKPDWLALAHEAAKLLAEEQFCEFCSPHVNLKHPKIGKKLIAELESRFPHLISA